MTLTHPWRALARLACAVLVAGSVSILASCGGGGTVPLAGVQPRALPADFKTRLAVNYSPYRGQSLNPASVTDEDVIQDLRLMQAAGFGLIRTFDSSDAVAARTLRLIRDEGFDIKVQLGVWIQAGDDTANQAEIARAVKLARDHAGTVKALSVGNETMVSWSFNPVAPAQMAAYIKVVRDQVTQPVTTNDNWAFWSSAPTAVLEAVDFIAMHSYPLADTVHNPTAWDWKQTAVPEEQRATAMMDAALARSKSEFQAVKTYLDDSGHGIKPIVIGETGWKAVASGGESERAHPVNQKMMFDRLMTWQDQARDSGDGPRAIFWFEAFDEPWKGGDDKWGLFNVQREARWVLQDRLTPSPQTPWEAGAWTLADAAHHVPVVSAGPVTASRYTVMAEAVTAGEARPAEATAWNAWENGNTAMATDIASDGSSDPTGAVRITPQPFEWGWGMALTLPTTAEDLTAFNVASGRLNFSIRTTYPGKIEVGFLTGTASSSSLYDVYLPIDPANNPYGYANDGQWHQISIPLADIIARGAPAYGMQPTVVLNLTQVTNPFVIADRYGVTGKPGNSGLTNTVDVDAIFWSR